MVKDDFLGGKVELGEDKTGDRTAEKDEQHGRQGNDDAVDKEASKCLFAQDQGVAFQSGGLGQEGGRLGDDLGRRLEGGEDHPHHGPKGDEREYHEEQMGDERN